MKSCTRCLYGSTHPLNITFDSEGVCSGCRVHEEKDAIDWAERGMKLGRILHEFRNRSGRNYDCIVPVSGARDSHFIVHTVKNVYGMNPLLVSYNKHYNTDIGIRNLANLRRKFNCDLIIQTVSPTIVKKITRATLRRKGSIYWHCLAGQTAFPVQIAVRFKIPLIVWGAHQGLDQVGMFSHLDEVEMTRKYRKEHDLMGLESGDLIGSFDGIKEEDVKAFEYPDDVEIERVGVRGIYLGNYLRWDSKAQHEAMIDLYGYEAAPQTRTFDTYNDVDCFNYSDVHDSIKYLKHGFGKVTDHACREIRLKRLTREEGLGLVQRYSEIRSQYLPQFLDWIGMTERGLDLVIDLHRDSRIWVRNQDWKWVKAPSDEWGPNQALIEAVRLPKEGNCEFRVTSNARPQYVDNKYVLVGKGYESASD